MQKIMDYEISAVYGREDIEGFYEAFLQRKKPYRLSKGIARFFFTAVALLFWALGALIFLGTLFSGGRLTGLPMAAVFAGLGLWCYRAGNRGFRSKASWKAYPNKGETVTFRFLPVYFTVSVKHAETKIEYTGIVRLYEDKERFYLFTSPQVAHILPKRDFPPERIAPFRTYMEMVTDLVWEQDKAVQLKREEIREAGDIYDRPGLCRHSLTIALINQSQVEFTPVLQSRAISWATALYDAPMEAALLGETALEYFRRMETRSLLRRSEGKDHWLMAKGIRSYKQYVRAACPVELTKEDDGFHVLLWTPAPDRGFNGRAGETLPLDSSAQELGEAILRYFELLDQEREKICQTP